MSLSRTYLIGQWRLYWLAPAVCLACLRGQSAVLIDGFTSYQRAAVSGGPAGPKSAFDSALAPEALGGERDLVAHRSSANRGPIEMEIAGAGPGIASYGSDVLARGSGLIVWDGIDHSSVLNPTGLGGLDLTEGGVNHSFRISRTSDLGGSIRLTIHEDTHRVSEFIVAVPAVPSFAFSTIDIPFAAFSAVGLSGGADFSRVGAISMFLDGAIAGTDIGVNQFLAVPEASTIWAGVFLLGFGWLGCRRSGVLSVSGRTSLG